MLFIFQPPPGDGWNLDGGLDVGLGFLLAEVGRGEQRPLILILPLGRTLRSEE